MSPQGAGSTGRACGNRRGGRSRPPRDEAAQRERLEAFHQQLTDQVLALADGPSWKSWLQTAAKFHHYSFNNTLAILMQRPDATQVAGYRTWQSLGRQVRKGEQGIQILAPVTRRVTVDNNADGRDASGPSTQAGLEPSVPAEPSGGAGDPTRRRLVGVRIAFVFDADQTDPIPGAPPLPTPPPAPQLLTGQAPPGLWDGLARQVQEAGFGLSFETPGGGARGRTNAATMQVQVDPDLDPAQRSKTLAHELSHVLMHTSVPTQDYHLPGSRARIEVEAESVAYLVTAAHGLDTSSYSFPYVGGWMPHKQALETTLRETGARVLGTAHGILERLDRDNPDLTIPAEDRAPEPIMTPPRVDGARAERRAGVPADPASQHGRQSNVSYGDRPR